jgi:hypothetical protein
MFLVTYNEVNYENVFSLGRVKISHFLNKLSDEFLGLTPAVNVTNFFCKNEYILAISRDLKGVMTIDH